MWKRLLTEFVPNNGLDIVNESQFGQMETVKIYLIIA